MTTPNMTIIEMEEKYGRMETKDKEILTWLLETGKLSFIKNKKPSKYYPTLKCITKYKSKSRIKAAFENEQPFLLMGKVVTKSLLKAAGITSVNVEFKDHLMVLEVT